MQGGNHHEDLGRHTALDMPSDRSFGFVLAAFFAFLAIFPLFRGGQMRMWAAAAGIAVAVCAAVYPKALHSVTVAAMKFSAIAGRVTNPIILGLLYAVVFTPMGMLMRMAGKDPLRLKRRPHDVSYWIPRDAASGGSMRNQF